MSHFPQGLAHAWVSFDASSGSPASVLYYNATVTDDGVGKFTVNFVRAFVDANYTLFGSARYNSGSSSAAGGLVALRRQAAAAKTTTTCAIQTVYMGTPSFADMPEVCAAFIGSTN